MTDSEQWVGASEENARFRLLVDSITDYAVYMLDRDGVVTTWNAGAERFKGYKAAEIIGQHFSRFYPEPDRAAGAPQRALEIAAREGRFETEGWRLRKDGTPFWTHVVIDPIKAPNGELIGFAKITRDLSERKHAEAALAESEEQFRRLVLNVVDYAIYMLSPEGMVTSWNLGAERIKGYGAEEIVGQHFSRFYPEEDRLKGGPARSLEMARTTGHYQAEGWRVRKDGSRFWASVVIDAIHNEQGELIGFAKITRDVTERLEQQKRLEQAREELFQAQKVEAIGQLTGGVAHDFNNLLMVILGSLEVLGRRVSLEERDRKLVDNAVHAAQRGAQLTQRMLAFARRQDLEQTPVDLPDLVRGMSDLLSRTLGPTILIETRFPVALPKVLADPSQLDSALLNLAVNARDAMPEGGPLIISAREVVVGNDQPDLKPGRYVCLAVEDRGEGMDAETLARATDPFFTTKGVGKGTGLGLPMVQGIAQQSGGKFLLKSQVGAGTTAEIWLPIVGDKMPELVEAVPEPVTAQGRRLKVLAVDDDALVLINTAMMLEELGHEVLEATSGEQALQLLEAAGDVDLVVTDQAMPRMTGLVLAGEIAARWPGLPVILASGYTDIEEARVMKLPRLAKPFSEADLERVIARVTDTEPSVAAG
ncbi:hybrid sensor histidine kinase/response regulator [Devosia rhizoryzae]|uniref:histidine kinase n=1 Tax=Devosia rhizoryzae TaxID=2774137 RepID=A0ABX7C611_9HYPH|nr:PAS domain-containing sensor histidine kinase [Devosia rhizoryzae]QQR39531.1 PAS domain S-box protein [Devosia rhizoryzae]